jgi:hypothetical protein
MPIRRSPNGAVHTRPQPSRDRSIGADVPPIVCGPNANIILAHTPLHASLLTRSSSIFHRPAQGSRHRRTRRDLHDLLTKLGAKSDLVP